MAELGNCSGGSGMCFSGVSNERSDCDLFKCALPSGILAVSFMKSILLLK